MNIFSKTNYIQGGCRMKGKILGWTMLVLFALCGFLAAANAEEIKIGALLSITGSISSSGQESDAALKIAVKDINDYLTSIKCKKRIKLVVLDTKADPDVALSKLQELAKDGIKFVIGPMTSGEVEKCKSYADKNGIILVSQSSTAPTLAIPNDNVFRLVPDDEQQAEVIAKLMWKDEIKFIVPIWRNDLWGNNLATATEKQFKKLGGQIGTDVKYDTKSTTFSAQLKNLNSQVESAIKRYGADAVGVYLISLNEVTTMFKEAKKYSALSKVKWYGSDGTALVDVIVQDSEVAEFAKQVRFVSPLYCGDITEERFRVGKRVEAKIGRKPDSYAYTAYDALWIITTSIMFVGETGDLKTFKKAIEKTANTYYGVTGWTALNEAGDRDNGNYSFWAVKKMDGSYKWDNIAKFIYDPALEGIVIYLK